MTNKEQIMLMISLQAVPENFWWPLASLQQGVNDQLRREENRLQAELCQLFSDDPEYYEKIMQAGPGARVCFTRNPYYPVWSLNPFLHAWVLAQLKKSVDEFKAIADEIRAAADIPEAVWVEEEYSSDVAQVVTQRNPLIPQYLNASELVPQVMAAHEERCGSGHTQQQG